MRKFILANSFPKGKPPKRRAVEAREAREENDSMCMQIIDLERIRSAFPPEATPDDIPLANSQSLEGEEETSVFVGKRWDELTAPDFSYCKSDIAFLSYPWRAYFIPALINCSIQELNVKKTLEHTYLVVDFAIYWLDSYTYAGQESIQQMHEIFSLTQVEIIQDWIYTLVAYDIEVDADTMWILFHRT